MGSGRAVDGAVSAAQNPQCALQRFKPYPAYKSSDIEWVGGIPAHWEVKRLRYAAAKIGSGKTPSGGAEVYVSEGIMLLRSQNVHFAGLRLDDVAFIDAVTDAEMAGSRVQEGDVLLNITGASLGRCCVARLNHTPANVNQHVCVIRPRSTVFESAFLIALKNSVPH
jgi:type I restriction enzyme, S subunit